ncbi:MAG: protoheme IX farnesyltransferase [Bdellovibrio sp.]|nr:protoheme IX farnesyltransferase [Bdellovibrio sp.]
MLTNLKRVSFFAIFCTFCLLVLGGHVHNTESSLACPDWPLCYGQFFPKMEGKIFWEHSHRLLASFVGFLTLLLVFAAYKRREVDKHAFGVSLLLIFMVVIQGVFGGITVLLKLSNLVSTAHLALSMIFFLMLIYMGHISTWTRNFIQAPKSDMAYRPIFKHYSSGLLLLIFLQIILGAFLRHSGVGAACGLGAEHSLLCFDAHKWEHTLWPNTAQAQMHVLHRYFAIIVALATMIVAHKLLRALKRWSMASHFVSEIKFYIYTILSTVLIQIFLGIWSVATSLGPLPTTLHLAVAASLLAGTWKIILLLKSYEKSTECKTDSWLSDYFELTKPKLGLLVLSTALCGMILARGHIGFLNGLLVLLFIYFVIAGGASLNCVLEKDVDGKMERTKNRPLPAGRLSMSQSLIFGIGLSLAGLVPLFLLTNWLTATLTFVAVVIYLFFYTPLKKKTEMAVFIGAIPGALPPLIGWTAVTGQFDPVSVSLFFVLFIWQLPHFFAISLHHVDDYKQATIYTYPTRYGESFTRALIMLFTVILVATSLTPKLLNYFSSVYFYTAATLGVGISLLALRGLLPFSPGKSDIRTWARRYFITSITYLPLLIITMAFFKL